MCTFHTKTQDVCGKKYEKQQSINSWRKAEASMAEECQSFEDRTQSISTLNKRMNAFKIQVRKGVQHSPKGIAM